MKRYIFPLLLCMSVLLLAPAPRMHAADSPTQAPITYEYITIRWAGRDNTHVIRPNGEVEFMGAQLKNFKKPDRADDRSFYMNIVMNGLAKQGWELAAMTPDDYVMKRTKR